MPRQRQLLPQPLLPLHPPVATQHLSTHRRPRVSEGGPSAECDGRKTCTSAREAVLRRRLQQLLRQAAQMVAAAATTSAAGEQRRVFRRRKTSRVPHCAVEEGWWSLSSGLADMMGVVLGWMQE